MFLATTALSQFWDKDQEIVFLGSWCLRHDCREEWEGLKYQVMPSPWNDRKGFYDAARYLDGCGERMLRRLGEYLNAAHGVALSERQWRILIGPWLLHHLHATYDRYVHLCEALTNYRDLQTVALDPRSFRTPSNTLELVILVNDEAYNLQLFSQLLRGMGYDFPAKALPFSFNSAKKLDGGPNGSWAMTARCLAKGAAGLLEAATVRMWRKTLRVGLCDTGISRYETWKLAWRKRLQVLPFKVSTDWSFRARMPVFDERRIGLGRLPASNEFERLFVQSLPQSFPTLYLEAFQEARAEVVKKRSQLPQVIVSATGWYFNEPFKFLAAEAAERSVRLVAVQHGGGYGIFRFSAPELHEARLGDSFLVWGWADKKVPSCRNVPNAKLSTLLSDPSKETRAHKNEPILFMSTAHPRYLYRFHSMPVGSQWKDYFEWELRFLAAVPEAARRSILYRPYPNDYGHAVRARLSEKFPDVRWDDAAPSDQRFKRSRLVIIDHCATSFLEALAANVPTLLFWDPDMWEVREQAEPYFDSLRKAEILWDSPEAAAKKIAEVYDEPWTWWGSEAVQEVRHRFVDRYALAREDWMDCWVKALEEEVALTQARGE